MTTKYLHEVNAAMKLLSDDDRVVFIGQAVTCPGHAITHQVKELPSNKIETPVSEELQAGMCLGLSLEGYIPVSIYPRWNFALLAANQIVNHIDKWEELTGKAPHIIFKIAVGSNKPLDPGPQHQQNFTSAFWHMLETVKVVELLSEDKPLIQPYQSHDIYETYKQALSDARPTIIVEHSEMYATGPLFEERD